MESLKKRNEAAKQANQIRKAKADADQAVRREQARRRRVLYETMPENVRREIEGALSPLMTLEGEFDELVAAWLAEKQYEAGRVFKRLAERYSVNQIKAVLTQSDEVETNFILFDQPCVTRDLDLNEVFAENYHSLIGDDEAAANDTKLAAVGGQTAEDADFASESTREADGAVAQ